MHSVQKTVRVGVNHKDIRKDIRDDYSNLPEGWTVTDNGNYFEKAVSIRQYDESDIADEQIREDANNGFDLRQRRENDWAGELMDKPLTSKGKQALTNKVLAHALKSGVSPTETLTLLQSFEKASAYATQHGIA